MHQLYEPRLPRLEPLFWRTDRRLETPIRTGCPGGEALDDRSVMPLRRERRLRHVNHALDQ